MLEIRDAFTKIGFSSDSRTIGGVGLIKSFADGVATVMLNDAAVGNKVKFTNWTNPNDFVFGCVKSFNADLAKTIIFADNSRVCAGDLVSIVGDTISIKSGEFEGTHVDTLGVVMPRDDIDTNFGFIYENSFEMAIEIKAPGIIDRAPVDEPLETGILVIDSLIPVGRGQRELIIGDRVTGKSSIAYDTMLTAKYGFLNNFFDSEVIKSDLLLSPNFRDYETCGVFCVYTCSGGRMNLLSCLMDLLEEHNSDSYSLIVSATASCPSILVYMSAFSGMTIAGRYMNRGMDSLIVLDDLTKQAEAFRCVSLLMRLSTGRDASYPGDIFYLHSRLLARSAKLSKHLGGGSVTALPIIETKGGTVSGYIVVDVLLKFCRRLAQLSCKRVIIGTVAFILLSYVFPPEVCESLVNSFLRGFVVEACSDNSGFVENIKIAAKGITRPKTTLLSWLLNIFHCPEYDDPVLMKAWIKKAATTETSCFDAHSIFSPYLPGQARSFRDFSFPYIDRKPIWWQLEEAIEINRPAAEACAEQDAFFKKKYPHHTLWCCDDRHQMPFINSSSLMAGCVENNIDTRSASFWWDKFAEANGIVEVDSPGPHLDWHHALVNEADDYVAGLMERY